MAVQSNLIMAVGVLCVAGAAGVEAATLIKFKDAEQGGPSQVWLEDGKARMEQLTEQEGYMIIDLKTKKQFLVSNREKQVIEIGGMDPHDFAMPGMPQPPKPQPIELTLDKKGKGPVVAGFATEHYVVSAGGQVCFEEYLAKKPLAIAEVKEFAEAMGELGGATGPGGPMMMQVCERAEMELARKYPSIGLPMRSFDSNGQLISEIEELKTGAEPPRGAFDFPAGYQRVTMQDMMQRMMQNMPQGGGMPPQ